MANEPQQPNSEIKVAATFGATLLVAVIMSYIIMQGGALLIAALLEVSAHPAMLLLCGILALVIILTVIEVFLLLGGFVVMRLMTPDKRQRVASNMRGHWWLFPFWPLGRLYTTLGKSSTR